MMGTLPSTLTSLSRLTELMLSANSLSGWVPFVRPNGSFPSLIKLDLSSNSFSGLLPLGFQVNLTNVDLSKNSFSGPIPQGIRACVNLTKLSLGVNNINGSIPDLSPLNASLAYLDLSFNSMSGPLPATLGSLLNLVALNLSNAGAVGLVGNISSSLASLSRLTVLTLSANQFSGPLPTFVLNALTSLTRLDLGYNQFSGQLSQLLDSPVLATNLQYLSLTTNNLGGALPRSVFSNLPQSIRFVDFSHNALVGAIPDFRQSLPNLFSLNLCCQKAPGLVGPIPSLTQLTGLNFLDMSENQLSGTLAPLVALTQTPITSINIAHNLFNGSLRILDDVFDSQKVGVSLRVVYMSNNELTGTITTALCNAVYIITVELQHNRLTGAIPDCIQYMPYLKTFNIEGNEQMRMIPGRMPSFLRPDPVIRLDSASETFSCPSWVANSPSAAMVLISPQYYNYIFCSCDAGNYGSNAQCTPCAATILLCPGGTHFTILEGWYMTPNPYAPVTAFLPCRNSSLLETPCQRQDVNITTPRRYPEQGFPCKTNYQGRLCSQCVPKQCFTRGTMCVQCPTYYQWMLPIVYLLVGCFMLTVCYSEAGKTSSPNSIVPIILFYIQMTSTFKDLKSIAWDPTLLSFFDYMSPINFEPFGWGCVADVTTYNSRYIVAMITPALYTCLSTLLFIGGVIWHKLAPSQASFQRRIKDWVYTSLFVFFFFLDLNYINVTRQVMMVLQCEADPVTNIGYLRHFPYASCNEPSYLQLRTSAYVMMAFFVILVPVLFTCLLVYFRHDLHMPTLYAMLGFLYKCYKPRYYWWDVVVLLRKFLLVSFLFLFDHQNYIGPLMVVIVFQLSIILQITVRPYNTTAQNFCEVISLYALQATFFGALIMQVDWIAVMGGGVISRILLSFNVLCIAYFLYMASLNSPRMMYYHQQFLAYVEYAALWVYYSLRRIIFRTQKNYALVRNPEDEDLSDDECRSLITDEDDRASKYSSFPRNATHVQNFE